MSDCTEVSNFHTQENIISHRHSLLALWYGETYTRTPKSHEEAPHSLLSQVLVQSYYSRSRERKQFPSSCESKMAFPCPSGSKHLP
jgi:hypothetical protein